MPERVIVEDTFYEACVEAEQPHVIKNVLLCGNESKNGYAIPPEAFVDEAHTQRLYTDCKVYVDHKPNHGVLDLAGVVCNVRFREGKPYGDIDTDGCPQGPVLLNLASKKLRGVGMSHVAGYRKQGNKVLRVEHVQSVDVVLNPATTKTFFENTNTMNEAELLAKIGKLEAEAALNAAKTTELTASLAAAKESLTLATATVDQLKAENTTLQADNEKFKAEHETIARKAAVVEEMKAAFKEHIDSGKLQPNDARVFSESFMAQLGAIADPTVRAGLIAERKAILEPTFGKGAVTFPERKEGTTQTPSGTPEVTKLATSQLYI